VEGVSIEVLGRAMGHESVGQMDAPWVTFASHFELGMTTQVRLKRKHSSV
jgi:hypothetical protein